jgi:DNA-directed RNA polymerase subunit E'/Rpb7
MQASILAQLKMKFEGRCSSEGFIQRNSITIINYSLGRTNYIKGGVDYDVQFQADVCMPHSGQKFRAPVTVRSRIGIHCETPPIKVLIPRDLHIGNEEFESIKVGDEIEFEVAGSRFKQQDLDIVVVAKLLTKISPAIEEPLLGQSSDNKLDIVATALPVDSETKQVVTTNVMETEKPKKRKLKQSAGNLENEQIFSIQA